MKTRNQFILGSVLLLGSAAVVAGTRPAASTSEQDEMEGHDHAAMLAGMEEGQPVALSDADGRRIGVSYVAVASRVLQPRIRALGVATWDETRLHVLNPKISGWVETLHVDFTGAPVTEGAPLVSVYSPELITAQEELVLAARLAREANSDRSRRNAEELLSAARRRLEYWDIAPSEIAHALEMGHVMRTLTLRSPATGFVVEKNVVEGDRIQPGGTLYQIADLSSIWVEVDVFERDLGNVSEGQAAEVTFQAFPDEPVAARVSYVYPTVSLESRTGRLRLEIANPGGRIRPGMYADVVLEGPRSTMLAVPQSAVLQTGERAIVFVQAPDGRLLPREVELGQRIDRDVVVRSGLREGERIASAAAFLIDAESNLGALSGEMDGSEGMDHAGHDMPGMGAQEVDHSGHDMSGAGGGEMDHSLPDTSAVVDHSGHDMTGMSGPDTTESSDHSGHGGHATPPDTTGVSDHSQHRTRPDTSAWSPVDQSTSRGT